MVMPQFGDVVHLDHSALRVLILAEEDEKKYVAVHLSHVTRRRTSGFLPTAHVLPTGDVLFIDSMPMPFPSFSRDIVVRGPHYDVVLENWRRRLISCLDQYISSLEMERDLALEDARHRAWLERVRIGTEPFRRLAWL